MTFGAINNPQFVFLFLTQYTLVQDNSKKFSILEKKIIIFKIKIKQAFKSIDLMKMYLSKQSIVVVITFVMFLCVWICLKTHHFFDDMCVVAHRGSLWQTLYKQTWALVSNSSFV